MLNADGTGEFCFYVNGQKMFARGTNWVPLDSFHSRDPEHLEKAFSLLKNGNINMVRVWGGGVYESDEFYDFCDENGITVWQDFMMGCASYPQSKDFCDKLAREAEEVVKRLRHHPCIALWSGDNEGDQFIGGARLATDPNRYAPTREVLPEVLRRNDLSRPFMASSPYMSPTAAKHGWHNQSKTLPERHLWGGDRYFKDPFYSSPVCHFVSESGQHGCPSPSSIRKFINEDKLWPYRDNTEWQVHYSCMETHKGATYSHRINNITNTMQRFFGTIPEDLDTFALYSQITQAEGLKFFMERARSLKFEKMTGMLIWNLLDGWPQFSDAVVDYYGTPKLAYHALARSQEPVCLMFREPENDALALICANETLGDVHFTYCVTDVTHNTRVAAGDGHCTANATAPVCSIPCAGEKTVVYLIEWTWGGKTLKNHYVSGKIPHDAQSILDGYRKVGLLDLYVK
jgi:beta-mannosidase